MTDLLTDLTAATEGSRDLSDRVLLALYGEDWLAISRAVTSSGFGTRSEPLDPTRNLQDAVDLVPRDKTHWYVAEDGASVFWSKNEGHCYGDKKPPALALCIALLKYMEKT